MCYTVPIVGAIITSSIWQKTKSIKVWWLNLLLWGGAVFGFVDHLWNKELFLISKDWAKDLSLGVVITVAIVLAWGTVLLIAKRNPSLNASLTVNPAAK
jgi:hypothetical protein